MARRLNVHFRDIPARPEAVGALLDGLASAEDRLWPEDWPPMELSDGLEVHSSGGHGPVRYAVRAHDPGRSVTFRFTGDRPRGVHGGHTFAVVDSGEGCRLWHLLDCQLTGPARVTWDTLWAPLHDALLEDALARGYAEATGERPPDPPRWNLWVRLLRRAYTLVTR